MNTRQPKAWKSCAKWPAGTIAGGNEVSEDTHATKEQAEAVCQILKRDGFGGNQETFPKWVWTEPVWQ